MKASSGNVLREAKKLHKEQAPKCPNDEVYDFIGRYLQLIVKPEDKVYVRGCEIKYELRDYEPMLTRVWEQAQEEHSLCTRIGAPLGKKLLTEIYVHDWLHLMRSWWQLRDQNWRFRLLVERESVGGFGRKDNESLLVLLDYEQQKKTEWIDGISEELKQSTLTKKAKEELIRNHEQKLHKTWEKEFLAFHLTKTARSTVHHIIRKLKLKAE